MSAADPLLAARYGEVRSPWGRRVALVALGVVVLAAAAFSAVGLTRSAGIEGKALTWRAGERAVSVQVELRGSEPGPVTCVVRAQDARSTDLGYGTFEFPRSPITATVDLPTLFRASSVAVLGCAPAGTDPRVPPPDFPPGVANPAAS
ncbi:MAG: DUF4307 domain-containing protein [Candidatus Nanopelagicales bacterium]